MKAGVNLIRAALGLIALMLLIPLEVGAETVPPPPPQMLLGGTQYTVERLDQMLALVALYPDPLLLQVLTAATYPLEIVKAERWLRQSGNAALRADSLAAALEQQPWDPSVKSLVPFPQVLRMMNDNLSWTEQIGDAFLANQSAVMDSVQRLRQAAMAAGRLQSTPQEIISYQSAVITILPPNPEIIYVPVYDPSLVYGVWPYPGYPPYYFPGFFDGFVMGGLGFGWFEFGINVPLWGWGHWDWGRRRIDIDDRRYNQINAHHPPVTSGSWQHDPAHRGGVPYRDTSTRTQFQSASPTQDARRSNRGFPAAPTPVVRAPSQPVRIPAPPPTFESFGRGVDVRPQAERGHASRQSSPASAPTSVPARGPTPAPASGGRGHR
jgi:hypothetical protein